MGTKMAAPVVGVKNFRTAIIGFGKNVFRGRVVKVPAKGKVILIGVLVSRLITVVNIVLLEDILHLNKEGIRLELL